MFHRIGDVGFFVKRNSWTHPKTVAKVISVGGKRHPPLDGEPPYYNRQNVTAIASYQGNRTLLEDLSCPGTYAYEQVDRPDWWVDDFPNEADYWGAA